MMNAKLRIALWLLRSTGQVRIETRLAQSKRDVRGRLLKAHKSVSVGLSDFAAREAGAGERLALSVSVVVAEKLGAQDEHE